jgi:putative Ca2+/H+ antiporter (TMEM165/GDT1 family)
MLATFAWIFGLMFVLELPDKTTFAAIIMAAKTRPLPVWVGGTLALTLHMGLAVIAGRLMQNIPHTPRDIVVTVLFFAGALYLLLVPEKAEEKGGEKEASHMESGSFTREASAAFAVLFIGEFGDLTQIQAANFAMKMPGQGLIIFIASSLALSAVVAVGAFSGSFLTRYVPLAKLRIIGGIIFMGFAIFSLMSLL